MASKKQQWQVSYYQPYQFNHVAIFEKLSSTTDPITGVSLSGDKSYQEICKIHYAIRNQTNAERAQLAGTNLAFSRMIVIRHNKELSKIAPLFVNLNGKHFRVVNYAVNDATYNATDVLTLNAVEKVG
ncbi:phage head closure protein [Limosilactobacillus antri]|uniref:phage head closure protein n=1 Tax=Limosilactobacillus antri TaxID=227943 RepID=UPI001F58EEAB|nr:phage head closure protein [Limosilactobacillus antri]